MKYRKKPVVIEAIQWNGNNYDEICEFVGSKLDRHAGELFNGEPSSLIIHTLEGDHEAKVYDYIIKGVRGEFYPCKPDIFADTYELVDVTGLFALDKDGVPIYDRHFVSKYFGNRTIFVISVFASYDETNSRFPKIHSSRVPGFRFSFEEAEEVVKTNMCDIWEYTYDYAVIEEIGCELYPESRMTKLYKYNEDIRGYEPIELPECLQRVRFCEIGS